MIKYDLHNGWVAQPRKRSGLCRRAASPAEDCNEQFFPNLRFDGTVSFVIPVGKLPTGTGRLPVLPKMYENAGFR